MATYELNEGRSGQLPQTDRCPAIRSRQRVGRRSTECRRRERLLEAHSWQEYAAWHLGLTDGASDDTKARYAFVFGDFRRVHRTALIACVYRASEWRHKKIELAAHDLLQHLDATSG
jgi:hypothetical protein